MFKVTSKGIEEIGTVRDKLPLEDLEEIARIFERYEHEIIFEDKGADYDGETTIYC